MTASLHSGIDNLKKSAHDDLKKCITEVQAKIDSAKLLMKEQDASDLKRFIDKLTSTGKDFENFGKDVPAAGGKRILAASSGTGVFVDTTGSYNAASTTNAGSIPTTVAMTVEVSASTTPGAGFSKLLASILIAAYATMITLF
jgi:hypothetical protein